MEIIKGISYNLKGLWLGIRTGRLFFLGALRFFLVLITALISAGIIIGFHDEIMNTFWQRPDSPWTVWVWHAVSWLLSLVMIGISTILSYILAQILFSVVIMDYMSRIVEEQKTGKIVETNGYGPIRLFIYLIKQEIPRAIFPLLISLLLFFLGWFVFLGPAVSLVSMLGAAVFLAWDNTDIVPARRLIPFKQRFFLLLRTLPFHLGFGLLFLIPFLNIVFLSFAPVGGTLYFLDREKQGLTKASFPSASSPHL
jgi:CysZ protein